MLVPSVLYGPTPAGEAIAYCEEVLPRAAEDRKALAITEVALAHLEAMRGNFEVARVRYRRSRAVLEEFGYRFFAALTSLVSGPSRCSPAISRRRNASSARITGLLSRWGNAITSPRPRGAGRGSVPPGSLPGVGRTCRRLPGNRFCGRRGFAIPLAMRAGETARPRPPARAGGRDHHRGARADRRFGLAGLAGQRLHGSRRGMPAGRPCRRRPRGAGAGATRFAAKGNVVSTQRADKLADGLRASLADATPDQERPAALA